ncbi:phosphatidylserine decarboxylase family protein [Bacteroidetes bacterium endosymbiont of Geopemphigus sp.]|uniref:phosphatidylserine decarboxylase family protein n=1 Tax=Bacteroidetes bacterium endosymbiont of Geopemphigus sp. TaxID=2047937 RepID=UPI000CD2C321|nr:phosphatidylserine decarboxylase family protein [Bacteroidetes bacterium endosymbiont of Geopemphigus sp.]
MMIHKEGYTILLSALALFVIIIVGVSYFFSARAAALVVLPVFLLYVFLLWFFRNPQRKSNVKLNEVVAPVDGKIVVLEEIFEPEFLKQCVLQLSIFMSPLNVHVTRYPVSGKIIYSKYHSGKYLVAWHPKSSTKNERTSVVVETVSKQQVLFRQIAGFLARRIVLYARIGAQAEAGKEFGFIKFGSRLDVFLPLGTKVKAALEDKVIGGQTILATLSDKPIK